MLLKQGKARAPTEYSWAAVMQKISESVQRTFKLPVIRTVGD